MRKLGICLIISVLVLLTSCSDERRMVGIWKTEVECDTWTFNFNSNGTFIASYVCVIDRDTDVVSGNYIISGSNLILNLGNNSTTVNYHFSSNANVLVLENVGRSVPGGNSIHFNGRFWLNKQPTPARNAFTGTWSGVDHYGDNIKLVVEGTTWIVNFDDDDYIELFIATYNGNSANIDVYGDITTATVSRNSLTWTVDGESFTLTKN